MKHDKGPWRADWYGQTISVTSTDGVVASCNPWGVNDKGTPSARDKANARLITAAPELLEAAIRVFEDADDRGECRHNGTDGRLYKDWAALKRAIKKAKGEK